MTTPSQDRRIFLGQPGYGKCTAAAARALWQACAPGVHVDRQYAAGSLLACNFNKLWCEVLTRVHHGERIDYFAMLHDDIGCEDFWLDKLIDELEEKRLDVLGVVVPIKDSRGITSIALQHGSDNWNPDCRLSMHDVFELPETFTSEDVGGMQLLLNTGCWVVKWNQDWCKQVHFEIKDRIVFDRTNNAYRPEVESEDWFFSRCLNDLGLKIGATRKIAVKHEGETEFVNTHPWGTQAFDSESNKYPRHISPVPNAFPRDISGWLHPEEGRELAELAKGQRVLEIGSYCGLSTVCIARTAESVTAVDYFDGRGTPSPGDTLPEFNRNIERYGVADKVTAVHADDSIPLPAYDLAFIDAAHDYDSVAADIKRCLEVLKPGGLLAFHDFKHPSHPGIEEAVDELLIDGFELISTTQTLAVVRTPARVPLEV